ncbi:histidinol-phosphate transaminase [Amylibacter kogurei]|uniref:Histidinol-phosphate aminotransferase n=1 Tax=Paramylibacter kogurei TaxID=1889778 RepID=A0A2G5KB20_9RHOB|nr:histidinol-phosphate transaminase [Amylibacter kogurei]PIB25834.1 histidinol-phosphate transaminase [Amylibacter kogurei]
MTSKIIPRPGIMDIELYVGGKGHLDGVENVVKLSSNENPLGPSPKAIAAYREESKYLNIYPSSDHSNLRDAIAHVHGLDAKRIICGNGSDEIITFLTQAFAGEGDEVVFTEHGFLMYKVCTLAAGATPVVVSETNRTTDVDAILAACNENTKLVFIANPNNPTGTMIDAAEVERLADGLPSQTLLVLDGAYAEFVDGFDGGASLIDQRDNIIMTRTFSKIYGLGGLRLGWAYAPQNIIDILGRLRGPFNVNSAALTAGLAAMNDQEYVNNCRTENAKWRDWLADELANAGMSSDVSFANFILVRFADEAEADSANEALQQNGLLVRAVKGYNLPDCLRITIGKGVDCKRVASVLIAFKQGRSK